VTGHSIGMTMIEYPRIREGYDVELREGMIVSMHPHAITPDESHALYFRETWLVGRDGAEPLPEERPHQRTHSCWARMPQSGWNW
jgi:Xaa-Pro dipeptidase